MTFPRHFPAGTAETALTIDDTPRVLDLDTWAFPSSTAPEALKDLPMPLTWERAWGVVADDDDSDQLVGMHASYPYADFPVPGATTAVSGLTWVGVHPGYRRRGILSAMIDAHFVRSLSRGEAISALFAAEPTIYGRFGYAPASQDLRISLRRRTPLRDVPGSADVTVRIDHADRSRWGDVVDGLHRDAAALVAGTGLNRPGFVTRATDEQLNSYWGDPEPFRGGAESRRLMVAERDGVAVGYARWRRTDAWENSIPQGTVKVEEIVAADAAVAHALWSRLLDLDLTATINASLLATDDPITSLLVDHRSAGRRVTDNLWVRILDVPTALAARQYSTDLDVIIEVTDSRIADNRGKWHVRASAFSDEVGVVEAHDAAQLSLDVSALSAAYLGGTSLASLAAVGQVTAHDTAALATASTAFGWPNAPVCSWIW